MGKFRRGLGADLRKCLTEDRKWWPDVREHADLAIAVRDKYLNIYSRGQSIFKVKQRDGTLRAETHYKYLVDRADHEYRAFREGKFDTKGLFFIREYKGRSTLDLLVKNAKVYAGNEKKHVHSIVKKNSNVIDVEIALTTSEPIREVWIHDEAFAASRLSMMRIMARRTKAATVIA